MKKKQLFKDRKFIDKIIPIERARDSSADSLDISDFKKHNPRKDGIIEIKSKKDEAQLEKDIENSQEEKENSFLLQSSRPIAPVLERVISREPQVLEDNVRETRIEGTENRDMDYTARTTNVSYNETRTERGSSTYYMGMKSIDVSPANANSGRQRANLLDPLDWMKKNDAMEPEVIHGEFRETRRKMPFEREEEKYKDVKF